MLGMRILVSACVIPALIFLFWLDMKLGPSAWILLAFCVAVAVRASYELTHLLSVRAMQPSFPVTAFLSTAVVVGGWLHAGSLRPGEIFQLPVALGAIAACIVASFSFLMLWECIRYASPGTSMESLGANVITVLYAGGLLAVTAQFRWFPDPELAYYALVAMIITVKSGDIGAYSLGRMLGRRKMAPRLSPGKTWMGGVGALLGSAAGGWHGCTSEDDCLISHPSRPVP
jgi:phosphatidate cytidylyltransferase